MYKAYEQKKEAPAARALQYMVFQTMCMLLPLLLITEASLQRLEIINVSVSYWRKIFALSFLGLNASFCFLAFNKRSFLQYEDEFDQYLQLNKNVKIWMLVLLPLIVLTFGLAILLLLFGGTYLGKEFEGLL